MHGGSILERDVEQLVLAGALEQGRGGQGSVVLVEGPAGSGKSTLLSFARAQARALGMTVLTARGSELERDLPYGIARELLGRSWSPAAADAWIDDDTPAALRATARIVQLHSALLSLVWPSGDRDAMPALLAVDDAHWADELSLGFLAHVALRADDLPVALVVTVRCSEPADAPRALGVLRASATLTLRPAPLSEAAVAVLTREQLGEHVDPAVSSACAEISGGNPFYVCELLRTLAADGTAVDASRVSAVTPAAVLRDVSVRVGRLGDDAAALARALAVLGDGVRLAEVAALGGLEVEPAELAADALAREGIVATGEPLSFAHPLIRSTLEADMGSFAWRRAHRHTADLLLRNGAAPARVAAHLLVAPATGDAAAVEALRAAAAAASAGGDPEAAGALMRRALDEPPAPELRGRLLLELARVETLSGAPGAGTTTKLALEHLGEPEERARALWSLATLAHVRGDLEDAVALATRGRSELPADHPLEPALLAVEVGASVLHPAMRNDVEALLTSLAVAAEAGELPTDPVLAAHVAGRVALEGSTTTVLSLARRAVADDPLIDPEPQGLSVGWLGSALVWVDELDYAAPWLDAAVAAAEARGALLAGATARLQRAWTALLSGRLEDAVADGEHALEAYRKGWMASPWSTFVLVSAYAARGELVLADEALAVGLRAGPDTPEHGLLLLSQSEFELARQDPTAALAAARAAGRHIDERYGVALPRMCEWRRWAALAAHRLRDDAQARELLAPALARLRQTGPPRQLGAALTVAGLVTADRDDGLALLDEGVRVLERSPARLEHARALLEHGAALRRQGHRTAAKAPLLTVLEMADGFGALPLVTAARQELSALGLRPRRTALTGVGALTPRERRIAELAAEGMSNPRIALELYVTRKTVETHLGHVYAKLGVSGRGGLASALQAETPA